MLLFIAFSVRFVVHWVFKTLSVTDEALYYPENCGVLLGACHIRGRIVQLAGTIGYGPGKGLAVGCTFTQIVTLPGPSSNDWFVQPLFLN